MNLMDCINDGLLTTWWIEPSTNILDMPFSIFKVTNIRSNIVSASQQKVFSMCIYNEWYVLLH
jgi:hypothetical protein